MFEDKHSDNTVASDEVIRRFYYYPFGAETDNTPWTQQPTPNIRYQYNGKEKIDELGLGWNDYGARNYDALLGRWMGVDALAEKYMGYSSYVYVADNPISLIDPDGMQIEGDIYNKNGKHIGSDNNKDDRVYIKNTYDDTNLSLEQSKREISDSNAGNIIDLTKSIGIKHSEFEQMSGMVYNEAKNVSFSEKANVASAIVNRKTDHSMGGTWQKTIDRVMAAKDSHSKRMMKSRVNPSSEEVFPGTTNLLMKNIRTGNYQNFINSSSEVRNKDAIMLEATKATILGLTGPDRVGGSTEWRGRGTYNVFGCENQKTSTFVPYNQ